MSKNSANTCNFAMGYAGDNVVADTSKSFLVAVIQIPNTILRTMAAWQKRAQGRANLKNLDAHLLKDIGMSRKEVNAEFSKPFWRS